MTARKVSSAWRPGLKRYSFLAVVCFTAKGTVTTALILSRGRIATSAVDWVTGLPAVPRALVTVASLALAAVILAHVVNRLRAIWVRLGRPKGADAPAGSAIASG